MDDIINRPYQSCIDAYDRCFQACRECSVLCLQGSNAAERKDHVDLLMKIAEMCQEASCSMSTDTKPVAEISAICSAISDECEKYANVCRSI